MRPTHKGKPHFVVTEEFVKEGADINYADEHGETALIWASVHGFAGERESPVIIDTND